MSKGQAGARSLPQPVGALPAPAQGSPRALPSSPIHPPVWVIELRVANHMLWMRLSPLALAPAEVQGDSLEEATFNL